MFKQYRPAAVAAIVLIVSAMTFATSFKDTSGGAFFQPTAISSLFGKLSTPALGLAVLTLAVLAAYLPKYGGWYGSMTYLLAGLYAFQAARFFPLDPVGAVKFLSSLALLAGLYLTGKTVLAVLDIDTFLKSIRGGLLVFGLLLIWSNFYLNFTGQAISPYTYRFYGTAANYNFLGPQLAFSTFAAFAALIAPNRIPLWVKAGLAVSIVMGAYLILLTGSRSGIVALLSSSVVYYTFRKPFSVTSILAIAIGACVLAFIAIRLGSNSDVSAALDRGGQNTRAGAFVFLWAAVQEAPFFGKGYFEGFSENSYLRGWASFGLVFPLLFGTIIIRSIGMMRSLIRWRLLRDHAGFLLGGIFALYLLGMTEAALTDSFSYVSVFLAIMFVSLDALHATCSRYAPSSASGRRSVAGLQAAAVHAASAA